MFYHAVLLLLVYSFRANATMQLANANADSLSGDCTAAGSEMPTSQAGCEAAADAESSLHIWIFAGQFSACIKPASPSESTFSCNQYEGDGAPSYSCDDYQALCLVPATITATSTATGTLTTTKSTSITFTSSATGTSTLTTTASTSISFTSSATGTSTLTTTASTSISFTSSATGTSTPTTSKSTSISSTSSATSTASTSMTSTFSSTVSTSLTASTTSSKISTSLTASTISSTISTSLTASATPSTISTSLTASTTSSEGATATKTATYTFTATVITTLTAASTFTDTYSITKTTKTATSSFTTLDTSTKTTRTVTPTLTTTDTTTATATSTFPDTATGTKTAASSALPATLMTQTATSSFTATTSTKTSTAAVPMTSSSSTTFAAHVWTTTSTFTSSMTSSTTAEGSRTSTAFNWTAAVEMTSNVVDLETRPAFPMMLCPGPSLLSAEGFLALGSSRWWQQAPACLFWITLALCAGALIISRLLIPCTFPSELQQLRQRHHSSSRSSLPKPLEALRRSVGQRDSGLHRAVFGLRESVRRALSDFGLQGRSRQRAWSLVVEFVAQLPEKLIIFCVTRLRAYKLGICEDSVTLVVSVVGSRASCHRTSWFRANEEAAEAGNLYGHAASAADDLLGSTASWPSRCCSLLPALHSCTPVFYFSVHSTPAERVAQLVLKSLLAAAFGVAMLQASGIRDRSSDLASCEDPGSSWKMVTAAVCSATTADLLGWASTSFVDAKRGLMPLFWASWAVLSSCLILVVMLFLANASAADGERCLGSFALYMLQELLLKPIFASAGLAGVTSVTLARRPDLGRELHQKFLMEIGALWTQPEDAECNQEVSNKNSGDDVRNALGIGPSLSARSSDSSPLPRLISQVGASHRSAESKSRKDAFGAVLPGEPF